jgi:hypothetical protein
MSASREATLLREGVSIPPRGVHSYPVVVWRIEYFEVLAQVGPVVLVAYVIEQRFPQQTPFSGALFIRAIGLLATLLAEAGSLAATAGVLRPYEWLGQAVAGLMLLGAAILSIALGGVFSPRIQWVDSLEKRVKDIGNRLHLKPGAFVPIACLAAAMLLLALALF